MIKKFEEYNAWGETATTRIINLSKFYHEYDNYIDIIHHELTEGKNIFINVPPVIDAIKEMLLGNRIEFVDAVMREKTTCTPNEINLNNRISNSTDFISIYCDEDKNTRTFTFTEKPNYIRIWGEETKIEKIIRFAKESEKYNL